MTGPKLNDGVLLLDGQVSTRTASASTCAARPPRPASCSIWSCAVSTCVVPTRSCSSLIVPPRPTCAKCSPVPSPMPCTTTVRTSTSSSFSPVTPTRVRRSSVSGRVPRPGQSDQQADVSHHDWIVARMSDERLEIVQARQAAGPAARRAGTSAQARRERRRPQPGACRRAALGWGCRGRYVDEVAEGPPTPTSSRLKRLWKVT